jgi:hypothetical protein
MSVYRRPCSKALAALDDRQLLCLSLIDCSDGQYMIRRKRPALAPAAAFGESAEVPFAA